MVNERNSSLDNRLRSDIRHSPYVLCNRPKKLEQNVISTFVLYRFDTCTKIDNGKVGAYFSNICHHVPLSTLNSTSSFLFAR